MAIKRIDGKETKQYSRTEYEAALIADEKLHRDRIGELVVDIETNPAMPSVWVANVGGYLRPLGGSGGAFTEFSANGAIIDGSASTTVEFRAADVQFCTGTQKTVGIDADTTVTPARLEFRVTPTGIPVDCPFSADLDMSSTGDFLANDFRTLGDEVGTNSMWDLAMNPRAGMLCFDLGPL